MPQYLAPGVYIEEVPPAARPIAGVGTSVAGFIGIVEDNVKMPEKPGEFQVDDTGKIKLFRADASGNILLFEVGADGNPDSSKSTTDTTRGKAIEDPNGKPMPALYDLADSGKYQLITNWGEFKNKFGDIQTGNKRLALAVYGYFNNGGNRCWVTRAVNLDKLKENLEGFEVIDEITLVAVPGCTGKVQQEAIIDHCEKMQDRFAILDGNPISETVDITIDAIRGATSGRTPSLPTRNSIYAALYFPWIKVSDPTSVTPDVLVSQPPSGHIAGVYARVDGVRGVFKAPANEVIRGAVDLERKLSKAQQEALNPKGVNVIRGFDGNIKIWGARTLGGDDNAEFKYVSTRRYMNFLRESIDEGTQWVVFEPNTPDLWQRITRTVEDFLLVQWQTGGLFGETPKKAFFVKCDHDTNPPQLRELGQVVTEIGVAIVKPAEFVIFRIQQLTGS